ncbi:iron ABC transporter permease [Paenibacillus urinalis]|uniref:Iron ABC transporter permease n=1 Tax=Paenibacillus urinalis TaxID=521520 RepID=A0AAX3N086_9BACL|nr:MULTISPECIES: iron ABC transporter permease [Paenibacillus]WDH82569.1 iron ABC transporter permease [Paenibacillus urinalis]WDH98620.1 iron ABC transporter permease [Paenibacillus urinalis]WDI02314.1 iron ABC transporter permease [Paenibacillus urinalis]GAK41610.1 iron ABC transporter permease protein [Paenibacillus sp. TCA20]
MLSKRRVHPLLICLVAPVIIAVTILVSILYGAKDINASEVWNALFQFDSDSIDHQIILTSRLPRVVGALLIGAFLAVSGALMQGMTRNYLASPSIMGVSDGSVFVITICMILLPNTSSLGYIAYSLIGSAIGAGIVFSLAWLLPRGMTPVRMAILGTIIGTFLSGLSEAAATYFQVSQTVSFWYNARLHQMDPELIKLIVPFAIAGLVLAMGLARSITILSMGEEMATSLGQRTKWVKALSILSVVILTGISVALAGKIGFVGLLIPHITRFIVGIDYKWVIPCSALIGGIFLAWCDIMSRFINAPFETPIGVVTAIFGVPFFLYLIKTRGGKSNA